MGCVLENNNRRIRDIQLHNRLPYGNVRNTFQAFRNDRRIEIRRLVFGFWLLRENIGLGFNRRNGLCRRLEA